MEANVTEKRADGSAGRSFRVTKEISLGRAGCDVNFPDDALLAPRHASVLVREGKLYLKDLGSQNGTFIKQRQDADLTSGDAFLLGRQLFRFTALSMDNAPTPNLAQMTAVWTGAPKIQRGPMTAKLEHIKLSGEVMEEFTLEKSEFSIGRAAGDLVCKDDPYMSGKHARILLLPDRFVLQDLQSRNGIYRRLRAEVELQDSDEFFVGEQMFRVEVKIIE